MDKHEGWEWRNDGKNALLPKWGYTSEVPGTVLTMKVNTTTQDAHNKEKMVRGRIAGRHAARGRLLLDAACYRPSLPLRGEERGGRGPGHGRL